MCGIAGIVTLAGDRLPTRDLLRNMCDTIRHRGPDDEGIAVYERVGFGMRRLSIIDVAGGSQPIFNEDRSVCTVFNGEIYNFRELRSTLESLGHTFGSNSDTEVIVHAYEEYGLEFPNYLNGMFAIAVYDLRSGRIVLARDHLGIKPLYFHYSDDYLVFGSEIKVLLASGLVQRKLDLDGLNQFIAWEYVPGRQTLLDGVSKLEAGCILEVRLDKPGCRNFQYWDLPLDPFEGQRQSDEWEDLVDAKVTECVKRQLVSDVPLGAFLSGGVDSSLIVAAMGDAETFSIGFDDPSYNELSYSQAVANHLNVNLYTEIIEPDVAQYFDDLMYFLDDPIGDFSIFPTYLVSRLARRNVTVALSGDGGDELFGGYETYIANNRARQYERIPRFLRKGLLEPWIGSLKPRAAKKGLINKAKRFAEGMSYSPELGHARWRLFADDQVRDQLFTGEARSQMTGRANAHILSLHDRARNLSPIGQSLYVDVKSYLVDNILTKVDRMSMAVSLESRVPFLDKELAEIAFQIPDHLKVSGGQTKVLLKRVAARHVPHSCVYRKKEGFSIPIKHWLGMQFRPIMEDLLSKSRIEGAGIFNWSSIDRLKREHLTGIANHSHTLWSLIVFEAWRRKWLAE